jgi:vacuolar-type H+-ATPase subunit H
LGLQLAPEIKSAYESNRKQIQKMIDEQRDPTQEEWDKLLNDIQSNTEELNA